MPSLVQLRKRLALPQTSWQICLLAIVGGALSALLIVLFISSIKGIQQFYLTQRDNYNSLDALSRFDLPIIGALIILLFAWLTGYKFLRTGIPFVLNRLKVTHGVMPLKNTLNQFFGGVVALSTGFSVGKEGPAVHLGAACSSYIGSKLRLPYNSVRTLCACGIAAGISSTFNTPIAAVIFVMEVILREYKIHVFIPIMLSAIVGSLITQQFFGTAHEYEFLQQITLNYHHYPSLILLGIALGCLAFMFNRYLIVIIKHSAKLHIVTRIMLAAFITGSIGCLIPYAMGTGLGGIDFSLQNQWQLSLLLTLLVAKFLMTILALGLGIPGGVIGPIVAIGAIAGVCASTVMASFITNEYLSNDFALMGMAGFLAATLNAPLTALLTVMELSNQIEIVIPAMIVITTASIVSGQFFKNRSIFIMQLDIQALTYRKPPIERSLQKIGVLALMQENFTLLTSNDNNDEKMQKIKDIDTIRYTNHDKDNSLINETKEQSQHPFIIKKQTKSSNYFYWLEPNKDNDTPEKISIQHKLIALSCQSTLDQAYIALVDQRCGGVYVYDKTPDDIMGFITFEQIRLYLVKGQLT